MNRLRPFPSAKATQLERRLLASARLDVPPRNAKARAVAVFGLSGAAMASAHVAGAATAAASAPATGVAATATAAGAGTTAAAGTKTFVAAAVLKGVAIGAVTGAITYGLLTLHRVHEPPESSAPGPVLTARGSAQLVNATLPPREVVRATEPEQDSALRERSARPGEGARRVSPAAADQGPTANRAPAPTGAQVREKPAPSESWPSLGLERALIDKARELARNGDPAAALRTLSEHRRQYAKPQLGPEATLVRIEALLKQGRSSEARTLGSHFLASQPDAVYAQRVRSLLQLTDGR